MALSRCSMRSRMQPTPSRPWSRLRQMSRQLTSTRERGCFGGSCWRAGEPSGRAGRPQPEACRGAHGASVYPPCEVRCQPRHAEQGCAPDGAGLPDRRNLPCTAVSASRASQKVSYRFLLHMPRSGDLGRATSSSPARRQAPRIEGDGSAARLMACVTEQKVDAALRSVQLRGLAMLPNEAAAGTGVHYQVVDLRARSYSRSTWASVSRFGALNTPGHVRPVEDQHVLRHLLDRDL